MDVDGRAKFIEGDMRYGDEFIRWYEGRCIRSRGFWTSFADNPSVNIRTAVYAWGNNRKIAVSRKVDKKENLT
jgi:hypothetical protein